ncbi:Sperm-associated antigen 1 HSD-3.8 Infertility-related sperm protein Spag-1 [Larimichthys crocea]|uniref:Sperm-associated antigen 1 HSD-3.8 Infertility-related sperm protein Spag-1 n=1 Tax=Larimichthys crocea TaxID=215358 RepID=A0A6G0IAG4_LARCR|nr:sperm-associated antigen 1 [Larimichthys crocea]KAE8288404.1 Sperm-associated antigen 1 HSD-3.8 Infertility-related sperm protein Spag-1 [Larimichthys crocea]
MSADAFFSLQNQSTTADYSGKVPVEHLDYDYIKKCKDVKYLEKILKVLRSGDEGIYPHLIKFCESHLETLDPRSRALRKDNPVATAASLSKDEWSQIFDGLKMWQEETKKTETSLKQQSMFDDPVKENMPPIRGSNCSVPFSQTSVPKEKRNSSKHTLPRDYREWDKFDVEKECERIDRNVVENDPPVIINTGHPKIKTKVDTSLLTQQEKLLLANREKDKGNEAFRANDYEEAVAYYSRSLSIIPTVAAYNNRAQGEIKLKQWHSAMTDCQRVLELEPGNMKALLRRATVYHHMGNFQMAAEDLRMVLREEPQNAAATQLLSETEKKMMERHPEKQRKGKKILIQEIEEKDDHSNNETKAEQTACPVEPSQPVGGEESSAAPAERGDMGNAQKKPHGRGDGGPHSEFNNSHHGHWKSKGGSSDKYKVTQESKEKVTNGTSKRGSTASVQADQSGSGKGTSVGGNAGETVNLDAPCGALPPPLARLKNEGNLLFKNGQFADALEKYSQAIQGCTDSGIDSPEDVCILYSNRAACYLKDGNSQDCIQDCTKALELQPFSLKPLLRRAMAYESLERYRKAYVDYKTVLQIDISVQAAHDSVNRITRVLIEQDGTEWREKLPDIPLVPLSAQQHRREQPPSAEVLQARAEKAARDAERKAEVRFASLKQEGNDFVKKGQYQDALGKYSECLKLKPEECPIYTNRALCYLKVERFSEAKQDCDAALKLEPTNKKAFYRRALANKGLKDYLACSSDLQEVLQLDPNVQEAEKELEEVTVLLRQSLVNANAPAAKPRKTVPITEVEGEEETAAVPNSDSSGRGEDVSINLQPAGTYEFGQALNAARCSGNMAACAELLASTKPEMLPQLLSTQLDGHSISVIMQALDSHLLEKDPNLVYQHLNHLHTADRFSVVLMLLEKDERRHMTQLFEHLSAVESMEFTRNDVQNLANKYI